MSRYEAVVIGCSAGGVQALSTLLSHLPERFPLALLVVQHMAPGGGPMLTDVLSDVSILPVQEAEEKEVVRSSRVYVAPANYHLLVEKKKTFSLSIDEKICFSRPSIDVLFETASEAYDDSLIGVLMTGANEDGSRGLLRIRENGGMAIVQDPETAEVDTMPRSAIELGAAQLVLLLEEIAPMLISLANEKV